MGDMPGGNVLTRRMAMRSLIIKEHVSTVRMQKIALVEATEKQGLVNPDIPVSKGEYDPLVRRRGAGGDQRRTDG